MLTSVRYADHDIATDDAPALGGEEVAAGGLDGQLPKGRLRA
jgi:hypothetical protein